MVLTKQPRQCLLHTYDDVGASWFGQNRPATRSIFTIPETHLALDFVLPRAGGVGGVELPFWPSLSLPTHDMCSAHHQRLSCAPGGLAVAMHGAGEVKILIKLVE